MPNANDTEMINDTNSFRVEAGEHFKNMREYKCMAKSSEKKFSDEFIKLANVEKKLAEEADRKAVKLILEKGSPNFPHCMTLDLHNLYIKEALPLVDRFLQTNMKLRDKVFISTGKGNHSKGTRSPLRDTTMRHLTAMQHRFTEDAKNKGEFTVYCVERKG